ncbi:interleukin-12 receptor subunit beta-2 isoform X1 [Phocoena sinus]|uniref:Interleukin-12 receptor subunit beta-2 n=1 Tax=Phocoena sinus TaxID=42100 RepID=A0A8C9AVX3_PHOSS|nr:interleukin-12 receptor subunit beta-2 isoform X1 [Phocoena sinus]XP_032508546.1 interleukin-12 receptor subunit beta-2 isoform X1 [Phocoena sinus]
MAHTVNGCPLALIFIVVWLLVKAKIDVCKRGDVTVQPSHVISLGSAVNISCSLKTKQGCLQFSSFNKLILYKFDRRIYFQHGHSLSSQVTGLPLGTTLFVCKLACSSNDEIRICGAEISVGVIPEQPQNLSCIQKGERGTVRCTWDRGQDTHLYTAYTLQLKGPKNLTWQKQCNDHYCDHLDLGINLTPESPESSYTAKVTAINSLGSASSFPSSFTLLDIVRPLPPWDIRIKFVNASVSRCTLQWRDEGLVLLNRLRYRPINSRSWNMVNATNAKGRHDLLDLKPFTEYEFQISSKLHLYKGSWSDWSESLRTQTPEEEPTGTLDVWYMRQHIDYNRQQISLFWKNLSLSEAKGKILHYQVTLQEVAGGKATLQNITERTSWTWVIPRTGNWAVSVSAANSKGSSLPTHINITDLCGAGLLAPQQVSANSEGVDNLMVTWTPPGKAATAVQEYVVEWRELHPGASTQPPLGWLWSPPYNLSALISENIKPYICYEIRVHALSGDQGGCNSIRGNSKHKAPLSGPHINAISEEKGSILISWNEIPAREQMGCILHYRIYWKEQDSNSQPQLCEIPYRVSPNSHPIDSLRSRVTYILWMTALTAAGESPQGNEREFCLQGKANWSTFVAPSICLGVIMVGVLSVRCFRQKVFVLLLALRPQWCSKEIPDPANSTWAKNFVEEKTQLALDRLLTDCPTPEEPETLVINKVLHQVTPAFRRSHHPNWPEKGQGVQGHYTSEEDTGYSASSPPPPRALTAETGQGVDLYKVLGSKGPDSTPGNPASPSTVLPVDYLPAHEGYLPSNIDYLPSHEPPITDPQEELPRHISLSIFPSSSLHPLTFSCGEKLTLDQLKMRCGSLML